MACGATLKRSYEFDPLHSPGRSPKRICGELVPSHKPQCPNYSHPPSFVEAAQRLVNGQHMCLPTTASSPARANSPNVGLTRDLTRSSSPSSVYRSQSASRLLEDDATKSSTQLLHSSSNITTNQPLLTLTQVDAICQRIVNDHEIHVREHFDKIVNNKLAEQYELFLNFNHDQVRRRFDTEMSDCSYVS